MPIIGAEWSFSGKENEGNDALSSMTPCDSEFYGSKFPGIAYPS